MIVTFLAERPSEILQNLHRLSPRPQSGQQQVPPPAIIRDYIFEDIRTLRFFPDLSARSGAPLGHIYADASKCVSGIQIETTSLSTK